tara:strand:+ start:1498 stop:1650 length:153 start_codon:yes stop_codon:yes gene_type:complete
MPSNRPAIFEHYVHPWYKAFEKDKLKKPNPPTKDQVQRAAFVDKTYKWSK